MSPRQLLYVTYNYYISEIDPVALAFTSSSLISTNTSAIGPLRYVADGSAAYAVNLTPSIAGRSLLQVNLATHAISELNYFTGGSSPPVFQDVFPASASRVFAVTTSDVQPFPNTLYDITPFPLSAQPDTTFGLIPGLAGGTLSGAISNEQQPSARYLYLLTVGGYLDRLD